MDILQNDQIEQLKTGWYYWLFPLIAVLITGWLFFNDYSQKGPRIRIYFDDASGIQAEKTQIRFRGVQIGTVKKVSISEDGKNVIVEALLKRDAAQFAVEGSKFSLILPKVNFEGVSGLETFFEGTYITVVPGPSNGNAMSEFKAQTGPGSSDNLEETTPYYLMTGNAESINAGDAVTFRGLKVGSVTKLLLSKDSQTIFVQVNIENKYVKLVRTNSVFWRKSGIQAHLGLFHSEVKINSLDTILHGGVELFTPDPPGPIAKALTKFNLESGPPKDSDQWNPKLLGRR